MMSGVGAQAVVEQATRQSAVVWVTVPGSMRDRPVWHLWHAGRAYVVTGGREQPLPGALVAGTAVVAVRSRDRQDDLLVRWVARVTQLLPGTSQWDEVVPLLHAKRLNAADGDEQPRRWAAESQVLVLDPTGELLALADGSGAAPPQPTPATTAAVAPGRRGYGIVMPPSTGSVTPVMYDAPWPARNTMAAASSSGSPSRPAGVMALTYSASLSAICPVISVGK